jgi:hypothetical protein
MSSSILSVKNCKEGFSYCFIQGQIVVNPPKVLLLSKSDATREIDN